MGAVTSGQMKMTRLFLKSSFFSNAPMEKEVNNAVFKSNENRKCTHTPMKTVSHQMV